MPKQTTNPKAKDAKAPLVGVDKATTRRKRALKGSTFAEGEAALAPKPERAVRAPRNKYVPGQHGAKKSEQKRLGDKFGTTVSGDTHESEHAIGFEPLNQSAEASRGDTPEARSLENKAWAYQEVKPFHRDHIGTGTKGTADASGFTSASYRHDQRALVEDGDISSAIQLNQLGYAFDPAFKADAGADRTQIANDSYDTMVGNMDKVTYAKGGGTADVAVDARQKVEMYLARRAAQTGKFPTEAEEDEARKLFKVPSIAADKAKKEAEEKAKQEEAERRREAAEQAQQGSGSSAMDLSP